ncbi:terpene cyclase/mutase family protein [Bacillus atrophaeus]|uniref:terpene cyclase/mutase family protein n=1 Tax=Bacillus atrophaeus TaxID=1452 RepID=UPI002DB98236|nr:prenyltransferase/squalene oxidase repeat-containing protein [Bacillus atrophaeus]MEC0765603.1 prenyltransferase/squalene oxidase repeat-containing protein [Bacillus atrophaeus]MEC0777726.1 prenyltransferase/squalene oxidase repeat-containing protein [Bacillus atrophaeus]MEC0807761.1 prenyltransferase/squalene oxidase repeat-containing protein [Bacillus atrophaeus]
MSTLQEQVARCQKKTITQLKNMQNADGSWSFCFEGPIMTNSFFILLLTSFEDKGNEELIVKLAKGIREKQRPDGTFTNYSGEEKGNVTATVQGYVGMLASGCYLRSDPHMIQAERFIISQGGLKDVHFMTKWMLAANGLYPWPALYLPLCLLAIPPTFPLHFYQFSTYARIHFVPMAVTLNQRFFLKNPNIPSLKYLDSHMSKNPFTWLRTDAYDQRDLSSILAYWKQLLNVPFSLHQLGFRTAKTYMLDRIEKDGTLYSYASATIFMIYSLLSLGMSRHSSIIQQALNGVKTLVTECDGIPYLENSTSAVWDTALISYALQQSGVPEKDLMITGAADFLLERQHKKKADWSVKNPHAAPGGWGFSKINTNNPDCDDTAAALQAIPRSLSPMSWDQGLNWLLSMQNKDGGFSAFERNVNHPLIRLLPLESAEDAAVDPSTPDLTGRVLRFLGEKAGMTQDNRQIKKVVNWLIDNQEDNGSWYGRWGVCYIYGTWAAITGMRACGTEAFHPAVKKAVHWLKTIQHDDGGWGESCRSAEVKTYVPLRYGTVTQTAWALDALLQYEEPDHPSITKGLEFLINSENHNKHSFDYPTGIGLPKQFYIRYHSYPLAFSLLAYSSYMKSIEKREMK